MVFGPASEASYLGDTVSRTRTDRQPRSHRCVGKKYVLLHRSLDSLTLRIPGPSCTSATQVANICIALAMWVSFSSTIALAARSIKLIMPTPIFPPCKRTRSPLHSPSIRAPSSQTCLRSSSLHRSRCSSLVPAALAASRVAIPSSNNFGRTKNLVASNRRSCDCFKNGRRDSPPAAKSAKSHTSAVHARRILPCNCTVLS